MSAPVSAAREDVKTVTRRRVPLVLGVVGLLIAAAVGAWWTLRPGPPTLLGNRTALGVDSAPRPLRNAAGFAGIALPDPGSRDEVLTFHRSPSIHFSTNTAAATARVGVCVRADGQSPVGVGYLTDLSQACSKVRYVQAGTRLNWRDGSGAPSEYLIVVVNPTHGGVATVDRVTYDYQRASGESGTDVGRLKYTVRAS